MSEFNNVTIVKKANVYFDGDVVSRTVKFEDGSMKTLGFMMPGEYDFNTEAPELMDIGWTVRCVAARRRHMAINKGW